MKKVVAFGTFDVFHKGHEFFLRQAKGLGDFLLVVVARDKNVEIAKGMIPLNNEKQRFKAVRKSSLGDKVILGSKVNNYFRTLRTYKINTIALGYDQKPSIFELRRTLRKHRLAKVEVIRLKAYNPSKYKSSKLKAYPQ